MSKLMSLIMKFAAGILIIVPFVRPAYASEMNSPGSCDQPKFRSGLVYVTEEAVRLFVRNHYDNHPSNNILGYVYTGDILHYTGNYQCIYGWTMVEVKEQDITDQLIGGARSTGEYWVAYTDGSGEYWLSKFDGYPQEPTYFSSSERRAYDAAKIVLEDYSLSDVEKQHELENLTNEYGQKIMVAVLKNVPVYDDDTNSWVSFDSWIKNLTSTSPVSTNAPINKDPIESAVSILWDPSIENIAEQLGLPWP